MVRLGGLEPPTSGSTIRRSNQLSYNRTSNGRNEVQAALLPLTYGDIVHFARGFDPVLLISGGAAQNAKRSKTGASGNQVISPDCGQDAPATQQKSAMHQIGRMALGIRSFIIRLRSLNQATLTSSMAFSATDLAGLDTFSATFFAASCIDLA